MIRPSLPFNKLLTNESFYFRCLSQSRSQPHTLQLSTDVELLKVMTDTTSYS